MSENIILQTLDTLKFVTPCVVLPILILWITKSAYRKIRENDQKFELEKLERNKQLGVDLYFERMRNDYDARLNGYLLKILFDIQKLQVSFAGKIDGRHVNRGLSDFQKKYKENQSEIAEFQFYLSPNLSNNLFKFFSKVNEFLVEIKEIKDLKKYELTAVSVYHFSIQLAEEIIETQNLLVKEKGYSNVEIKFLDIPYFKKSCGELPPVSILQEYEELRNKKIASINALEEVKEDESLIQGLATQAQKIKIKINKKITSSLESSLTDESKSGEVKFTIKSIRRAAEAVVNEIEETASRPVRKIMIKEIRRAKA